MAIASGDAGFASAAAGINGVTSVIPDIAFDVVNPKNGTDADASGTSVGAEVTSIGDDELFYPIQWALPAIQAPEAWNAGYTGTGVRVAILDGGLYNLHTDLDANVDVAASRSFVPGFAFNQDVGTFWHGTHVAGIVGAENNAAGTIGVAPNATLIGVKVLHNGTGSFGAVIDAIMYAAAPLGPNGAGADVINISLGAVIPAHRGNIGRDEKKDIKELTKAIDAATSYAWDNGVTVVASAGNDAIDFDASKEIIAIPASAAKTISVSATAPIGWAYGNTDYWRQASYTNIGKSAVDLSAPGGDFAYPGNESCTVPLVAPFVTTAPCWVFDMYLSTSRAGYTWAAGTSMAAPVVSGVAALIIQKAGGDLQPAQVKAQLQQSALDLGTPGKDPVYGHGWVNAYRAIQ